MAPNVGLPYLPITRQPGALPFVRLAQELGYAKEKTARDQLSRPYLQVAKTNEVLRASGHEAKAVELMTVVDASMQGALPCLADAVNAHNSADATEDVAQADFIKTSGDEQLEAWIKRLASDLKNGERLLACLVAERQKRRGE